jgi:hypothetical protein
VKTFTFDPALFRRSLRVLAALASDPKGQAAGYVDEAIHVHTTKIGTHPGLRLVAADGHRACAITLGSVAPPVNDGTPASADPIDPRTILVPADPETPLLKEHFYAVTLQERGLHFHAVPQSGTVAYGPAHRDAYPIDVVNEHLRTLEVPERPNKRAMTLNADYVKDGLTIVSALFGVVNAVPKMEFVWPLDVEQAFGIIATHTNERGLVFDVRYIVMPYRHI